MLRLYRWLAEKALWIVTGLMPVVIAACYGMYYEFTRNGRVVDRSTGAGISGIKLTCQTSTPDDPTTYTDGDGRFLLEYDSTCHTVLFEDVDGAENGSYQTRTLPGAEFLDGVNVELDPTVTP